MILFLLFGALALGAGIAMVIQRNPVHAALLLVLNLLSVSVLFLTLGAEFLFAAQIIVYAGAIVVLFLFVIMLLGVDRTDVLTEPRRFQMRQLAIGAVVALVLLAGLAGVLSTARLSSPIPDVPPDFGSAESIGEVLFRTHLLPFEITGLILLVATIGILMLGKRRPL